MLDEAVTTELLVHASAAPRSSGTLWRGGGVFARWVMAAALVAGCGDDPEPSGSSGSPTPDTGLSPTTDTATATADTGPPVEACAVELFGGGEVTLRVLPGDSTPTLDAPWQATVAGYDAALLSDVLLTPLPHPDWQLEGAVLELPSAAMPEESWGMEALFVVDGASPLPTCVSPPELAHVTLRQAYDDQEGDWVLRWQVDFLSDVGASGTGWSGVVSASHGATVSPPPADRMEGSLVEGSVSVPALSGYCADPVHLAFELVWSFDEGASIVRDVTCPTPGVSD